MTENKTYLYNKKYPVKKFALELTNICTLKCQACSRNLVEERGFVHDIKKSQSISLDLLKKIFPPELEGMKKDFVFDISGNFGDCIYHPQFLEIMSYFKSIGIRCQIITNGSYRKKEFWEKLGKILTFDDLVVFSVDGLEDTNHLYRKNSRWSDIIEAMGIMANHTEVHWKWIVFRHNEHQIEEGKQLAKSLGVHKFIINKSGRFTKKDALKPLDPKWRGLKNKNKIIIRDVLRTRSKWLRRALGPTVEAYRFLLKALDRERTVSEKDIAIMPKCQTGNDIFISCEGHLFPCCYARDMTKKSFFLDYLHRVDLNQRSIDEVLADDLWSELEHKWALSGPEVCLRSCGVAKECRAEFGGSALGDKKEGADNITHVLNTKDAGEEFPHLSANL